MSLGITHILAKSNLNEGLRLALLEHPFFYANPKTFELQRTYILNEPVSEYDRLIFEFLAQEKYDHTGKIVEYWFQQATPPEGQLRPHCDYNYEYREKMKLAGDDWPHQVDKNMIVSPITIAAYLYVSDDMQGGELGISTRTWMEEPLPTSSATSELIKSNYPFEFIKPVTGDILYFKGSEHYHWIETVIAGERKSLLLNFWPKELLE
jgi:hypothetical protein